uniref:Uncharacterized protein n=1 Tax=Romanomermis culicivorax TaxID=13658 RepID=A0A915JM88_ROMCU
MLVNMFKIALTTSKIVVFWMPLVFTSICYERLFNFAAFFKFSKTLLYNIICA